MDNEEKGYTENFLFLVTIGCRPIFPLNVIDCGHRTCQILFVVFNTWCLKRSIISVLQYVTFNLLYLMSVPFHASAVGMVKGLVLPVSLSVVLY